MSTRCGLTLSRRRLLVSLVVCTALGLVAAPAAMLAQGSAAACPRYAAGSAIPAPVDLFSTDGVLTVDLTYQTRQDADGNALYCFMTDDGAQSPTLHVEPGDELIINFKNGLATSAATRHHRMMPAMTVAATAPADVCGAAAMDDSSTNIHFHGTNTPPTCHQDEVIRTLVNAGESFTYDVHFPADEPPGLYWYHPHVHGISEAAVQGGASGAIVVEGIERFIPAVAGLRQQVLMVRDSLVAAGSPPPGGAVPSWDLSLNYVPIAYPAMAPAAIPIRPLEKQLWRVVNASADTILDLQLRYDGRRQPLQVVALDGVPVGSQDGTARGRALTQNHVLLAPSARAELIVTAPGPDVRRAALVTLNVDTGPDGDNDPSRTLANLQVSADAPEPPLLVPAATAGATGTSARAQRFAGLAAAHPAAERKLYFSEVLSDPSDPDSPTNFFITVDGQTPALFSPDNPPAIVTTQGTVEDWTIENRALENHEFHMHQIHFLVLAQNGVPVANGQYLDVINVPYWSGHGPYPSVKVRMDFRGSDVGDFVYHCHILGHEDSGMMAIIRVQPAP
jgi:FtsP/CotA-like multicopper oxidase with cupredoxin domain